MSVRHKNLALWQAALIGLAFALLVSFWAVFNGVYFERELPIRFIIGFLSGTVLAYLLGNACLYLLRRYRDKE